MSDPLEDVWYENRELRAEIERLKTALEKISHIADDETLMGCAGYDYQQMHLAINIARGALGREDK